MLDLNYLISGKRKKETKKVVGKRMTDDFNFSFLGKGNPNPRDKITRQQRPFLRSKSILKKFGDKDKDGVINALDCRPRNPKRHGTYYRGIDDMELKLLKIKGKIEPRRYKPDQPNRIWITKQKEIAKRYGDNLVEMELDDSKVKSAPGRSKMVYIEDEIWPGDIKGIDEDLSEDGYDVE